jgi:hypothetical protein
MLYPLGAQSKSYTDLFMESLLLGDDPELSNEDIELIRLVHDGASQGLPELLDLYEESPAVWTRQAILDFARKHGGEKFGFLDLARTELKKILRERKLDDHDYRPLTCACIRFLGERGDSSDRELISEFTASRIAAVPLCARRAVKMLEEAATNQEGEQTAAGNGEGR